jgi:DUF971 family protein
VGHTVRSSITVRLIVADVRETPRTVSPTADGTRLEIQWDDDHVSQYEPRYLRLKCPCAGCVDEMTGQPILDQSSVPEGVHPLEIQYVGRYALLFVWSDGHRTGIYPFAYLRQLCPCGECTAEDPSGSFR